MNDYISSIAIENFRSIRGSISIDLDASIVLIYGRNGTGKTSILSALELSLTGHINSLARLDENYRSHLVHKETEQGRIETYLGDGNGGSKRSEWTLFPSRASGEPLLSRTHGKFFSERCYLAQSTLGRLLEIYEHRTSNRSDSPLTIFVKELLGLDYMDSLVEGLHFVGDIRRLRTVVPTYWEVREGIPKLESDISENLKAIKIVDEDLAAVNETLSGSLEMLGIPYEAFSTDSESESRLDDARELEELNTLAATRIRITAARNEWEDIEESLRSNDLQELSQQSNQSSASVQDWWTSTGVALETVLVRLDELFPDLLSYEMARPENARKTALIIVNDERERCQGVLLQNLADVEKSAKLGDEIAKFRLEIRTLNEEIGDFATDETDLAALLSGILRHLESDDCPVCGRDFRELGAGPLESRVSHRVRELTKFADQLRSLFERRAERVSTLAGVERSLEDTKGRQLSDDSLLELNTKRAQLMEIRTALEKLEKEVLSGQRLISQEKEAIRKLDEFRSRNQRAIAIRESIRVVATQLKVPTTQESEDLERSLERLLKAVSEKEEELRQRQAIRERATKFVHRRRELIHQRVEKSNQISKLKARLKQLKVRMERADERIVQAREFVRSINGAKADIVRRVFDDSLNLVWRDLFIRLAPDEPFVPAFAVPQGQVRSVEAVLETLYRSGGKGGSPRAMLSSGNLNTAALTLFIALHLSVEPTVPILVVDDPVQSMDEVHVSQFVALLRTLSKLHNRQVIISVHEKPLFDYLALELSPAFESDRLITVEIENGGGDGTLVRCETQNWRPDPAIAA